MLQVVRHSETEGHKSWDRIHGDSGSSLGRGALHVAVVRIFDKTEAEPSKILLSLIPTS